MGWCLTKVGMFAGGWGVIEWKVRPIRARRLVSEISNYIKGAILTNKEMSAAYVFYVSVGNI